MRNNEYELLDFANKAKGIALSGCFPLEQFRSFSQYLEQMRERRFCVPAPIIMEFQKIMETCNACGCRESSAFSRAVALVFRAYCTAQNAANRGSEFCTLVFLSNFANYSSIGLREDLYQLFKLEDMTARYMEDLQLQVIAMRGIINLGRDSIEGGQYQRNVRIAYESDDSRVVATAVINIERMVLSGKYELNAPPLVRLLEGLLKKHYDFPARSAIFRVLETVGLMGLYAGGEPTEVVRVLEKYPLEEMAKRALRSIKRNIAFNKISRNVNKFLERRRFGSAKTNIRIA